MSTKKLIKILLICILPILSFIVFKYMFYVFAQIEDACIPSGCGIDPEMGLEICTADCEGKRSYLMVYLLSIVEIFILLGWLLLIFSIRKNKEKKI